MLTKWDKSNSTKGAAIVEIIVAIGIFTIVAGNIVVLALGSYSSSLRSEERMTAQMLLQEGLTATHSIANYSYANLTNGTHGITDTNGYWEFSGGNNVIDQYTRTIQITDTARAGGSLINNSDCSIIGSGGQVDSNTKLVSVTVSWDLEDGNTTSLQGTEYIPDWRNREGCGESSWLSLDASAAYISADNLTFGAIDFDNSSSGTITISTITPSWSNGAMLEVLSIDGNTIWEAAEDPYVPSLSSGTPITVNTSISSGSSVTIDDLSFDSSMADETVVFWLVMSDGTARYMEVNDTPGTPPPPPPPPPPPEGDEADDLSIDIGNARLISHYKKLIGIVLENTGSEDITIDKITVAWAWAYNGTKIRRLWIDGDEIWDHNESNGTLLDVDNFTLEPGEEYPFEALFNKDMWWTLIQFEFTMTDGSTIASDVIWAF